MRWLVGLALIAVLLLLAQGVLPAEAQTGACAMHDPLIASLGQKYGERVVAKAKTPGDNTMELMVSPQRTWSLIVTGPHGLACLFAYGTDFEKAIPEAPGEDS